MRAGVADPEGLVLVSSHPGERRWWWTQKCRNKSFGPNSIWMADLGMSNILMAWHYKESLFLNLLMTWRGLAFTFKSFNCLAKIVEIPGQTILGLTEDEHPAVTMLCIIFKSCRIQNITFSKWRDDGDGKTDEYHIQKENPEGAKQNIWFGDRSLDTMSSGV